MLVLRSVHEEALMHQEQKHTQEYKKKSEIASELVICFNR